MLLKNINASNVEQLKDNKNPILLIFSMIVMIFQTLVELNSNDKNLMIFDDCILEKQSKAEAYYTRGRHNNCDSFYISQNYFLLPRKTIRENANFLVLFPQDDKNLNHIHKDHCI